MRPLASNIPVHAAKAPLLRDWKGKACGHIRQSDSIYHLQGRLAYANESLHLLSRTVLRPAAAVLSVPLKLDRLFFSFQFLHLLQSGSNLLQGK